MSYFLLAFFVSLALAAEPSFPNPKSYTVSTLTYNIEEEGFAYFGTYYIDRQAQRYRVSMNATSGVPNEKLDIYFFAQSNDLYYVEPELCSHMQVAPFGVEDFDILAQMKHAVYAGVMKPRIWNQNMAHVWNVTMADTFPATFYASLENMVPLEIDEARTVYVDVVFVNFETQVQESDLQLPAICKNTF